MFRIMELNNGDALFDAREDYLLSHNVTKNQFTLQGETMCCTNMEFLAVVIKRSGLAPYCDVHFIINLAIDQWRDNHGVAGVNKNEKKKQKRKEASEEMKRRRISNVTNKQLSTFTEHITKIRRE